MNNFLRDAAHGLRVLRRNPGFAAVAILALALGIGANSAIFSVIYGTLLAPLPYHDGERIAVLWSTYNGNRNVTSIADYLDWKRLNTTFEALCTGNGADFNLTSGDHPERISGTANTPGCTDVVFGEKPLLGRYFVDDDAQAGRDHVVVGQDVALQFRSHGRIKRRAQARTLADDAGFLCLIAALASWLPARRAAAIHPMTALRTE